MNITVTCNNVSQLIEALTKFGGELPLANATTVITSDSNVTLSVSRPHKARTVKKAKSSKTNGARHETQLAAVA